MLADERFARLRAIEWWDQVRVGRARVLVVGAGALGNEVVKNLALLGIGSIVVVDMDRVEKSNLTRAVLLRESDEGKPKASCVARAARELYPDLHTIHIVGNVAAALGLGLLRSADVVVGAVDNREARIWLNGACARVGRPWIDGGIEVLRGIVRGFAPPETACYECTMSALDWQLVNRRRSCSLLARRAIEAGGAPTTPTTASIIAALQVQEVIKHIHGMPALLGRGWLFDGTDHSSYLVTYPINPECTWHEPPAPIRVCPELNSRTPLATLWQRASEILGGCDALDLGRELVEVLTCPGCAATRALFRLADTIPGPELVCPACGVECTATFGHVITGQGPALRLTPADLGLPRWDVVWARRQLDVIGLELAGDSAELCAQPGEGVS